MRPEIFESEIWQMEWAERAALEGLLSQIRPRLAVEIGTADGACLTRLAAWAEEVHSFDLTAPTLPVGASENVTLHTGDSHELLPQVLAAFAEQERDVDLFVVDGDHSPEGVRRDLEDILNSAATRHSAIVIHDTANPRVREGLDATRFAAWPKVAHVDLDWVPGRLYSLPRMRHQLWSGLGLVLVDVANLAYLSGSPYEDRYYPAGPLLRDAQDAVLSRDLASGELDESESSRLRRRLVEQTRELAAVRMQQLELQADVGSLTHRLGEAERVRDEIDQILADVVGSASWKLTRPLRAVKRARGAAADDDAG